MEPRDLSPTRRPILDYYSDIMDIDYPDEMNIVDPDEMDLVGEEKFIYEPMRLLNVSTEDHIWSSGYFVL